MEDIELEKKEEERREEEELREKTRVDTGSRSMSRVRVLMSAVYLSIIKINKPTTNSNCK